MSKWHRCALRFNGAALWGARRSGKLRSTETPRSPASTGPRSGERGDAEDSLAKLITQYVLQRGRALGSAEMRLCAVLVSLALRSFNGAALWGARRCVPEGILPVGRPEASTGPRSGERGDVSYSSARSDTWHLLQRGRALGSAEITQRLLEDQQGRVLQRGRALGSAEISGLWKEMARIIGASTGPRSGERGDDGGRVAAVPVRRASTGPRSGERGDPRRP